MLLFMRLFAAAALLAIILPTTGAKEMSLAKMKKNFDKINAILDKETKHATDPVRIMMRIETLVKEFYYKESKRCFSRPSESYIETLKMLARTQVESVHWRECNAPEQATLLEKLDSVWFEDPSRAINLNYRLTKIDEFLSYYAFSAARHCKFNGQWPTMNYAYKQLSYDYINQYLLAQQPNTDDIEANLNQVQEHLNELDDKDGALARALKQILELRSTLREENCNVKSYEILLRNDLGTRGRARHEAKQPRRRRIDKIVYHFMKAHQELCQPRREQLETALKGLSVHTYRYVLSLVNFYYYLGKDRLKDIVEYLDHKEVSADFTTPLLKEFAEGVEYLHDVGPIQVTDLRQYVKTMNAEAAPKSWSNPAVEAEERRKFPNSMIHSKGAVNDLFDKYLILPCSVFLDSVGGLSEADRYRAAGFEQLDESSRNLKENLSYHMILAAYQLCKVMVKSQRRLYYGFNEV